jgi:hypothetical protein
VDGREDDDLFMDADAFERSIAAEEEKTHAGPKKAKGKAQKKTADEPLHKATSRAAVVEEKERTAATRTRQTIGVSHDLPEAVETPQARGRKQQPTEEKAAQGNKKGKKVVPAAVEEKEAISTHPPSSGQSHSAVQPAPEAANGHSKSEEVKAKRKRKHKKKKTEPADADTTDLRDTEASTTVLPSEEAANGDGDASDSLKPKRKRKHKKKASDANAAEQDDAPAAPTTSVPVPSSPIPAPASSSQPALVTPRPSKKSSTASSTPIASTVTSTVVITGSVPQSTPTSVRTPKSVRISLEHNRVQEFQYWKKLEVKEEVEALLSRPSPKPAIKRRSLEGGAGEGGEAKAKKVKGTTRLSMPAMRSNVSSVAAIVKSASPRNRPTAADFF